MKNMPTIAGHTKVYGIFGDPIAHSLSPLMQNFAIRTAGLDAIYVPFHVEPTHLPAAVDGLRAFQLGGINVTLPHKQQIIPLLDSIDEDATLIGAVNTVVNRKGTLTGYNTDGLGFIRALRDDLGFNPQGRKVMLFGAGGACRAAVVALLRSGASALYLVNRSLERAQCLQADLSPVFSGQHIRVFSQEKGLFLDLLPEVDLVVNTTSVGLKGEEFSACPLDKVKASASVYDMVYSAVESPFVCAARARGLSAVDGLGMLAGQGEAAFSLWFNLQPKKSLMKDCLLRSRASY